MKRRRILQALGALPMLRWPLAVAQSPDRNLMTTERQAAPGVMESTPLLLAPRHALVIGNGGYGFSPLKNPPNDARAIAGELKRAGFEVTVAIDQGRSAMLEAIDRYGESLARSKAVGIFDFAGHGVQLAWRNYLLPTDAEIAKIEDIQAKCVDVNAVIEGIAKAANPMNVVILDACRENPFQQVKLDQKGLSQLDAPPATLLAYATAPGNLASDGEGANGLYTEQLLRELKVPEAKIEDVFKRVRLAVRRRSNGAQIPWESTSLEEDFWFIPPREQLRLAQEEAERQRSAAAAERQRQERIARAEREEAERQRQVAEAERLRQERIAKAERDEAERLKREAEAERVRQESIAKAKREEAERLKREAEAERARLEQQERERREQLERARQEEQDRAYQTEVSVWERAAGAKQPGALEDYLRRYPSGNFAELAQLQLDALLARQGEKPVQVVVAQANPFTQGFVRADTAFKVSDSYSYVQLDRDTKAEQRRFTTRVTEVTDEQVIFNNGAFVVDRLGNSVRLPDGRSFSPRQDQPLDYAIGKKWTTRFTVKTQGGSAESEFSFRITRREKVTVPAGTFDCYVIEGEGSSINNRGFRLQLRLNRWMAPDKVRRPIIIEQYRKVEGRAGAPTPFGKGPGGPGGLLNNERNELIAFSQS